MVCVVAPIIPVSYTHLRAHETVLDLVCRLLLQKKKLKNQTPTLSHITVHTNLITSVAIQVADDIASVIPYY